MSKTVKKVIGGGGSPGAAGTGRFRPERVKIEEESFRREVAGKGPQEVVRQAQRRLSEALESQALGEGPSIAEQQLRRGQEAAVARSRAETATARTRESGLAARESARTTAETQRQVSSEAAQLRAEEQARARGGLAAQLAQEREQDIGLAQADRESSQLLQQLRVAEAAQANKVALGGFTSAAAARQNLLKGVGEAIAFSDKNAKKDVKSGDDKSKSFIESLSGGAKEQEVKRDVDDSDAEEVVKRKSRKSTLITPSDKELKVKLDNGKEVSKDFLDNLKAVSFRFKDEANGEGEQLGILAQDLEKSPEGKQMVMDTPEGKMVDFGKGFGAILAAQAQLNNRLKQIESKSPKSKEDKES